MPRLFHHRARLRLVVLVWGAQAIVAQSLLIREAHVLMFGSEFAWGVVLAAWLFGVAVGGVVAGRLAERLERPEVGLVTILIALSVVVCVELWLFRGARALLHVTPGELVPLETTALAAIIFVSPASVLVGMAFPLACCIVPAPRRERDTRKVESTSNERKFSGLLQLGNVYAVESAGSLIGGALFTFWAVERLAPIQTALGCAAATAGASAVFLFSPASRRIAILLALVSAGAFLTSALYGRSLDRLLIDRRWQNVAPGYELCAETESKYQNLTVGRRGEQYTLYSDGLVTADFPDPYTFVPQAHFRMCQHPDPKNVLVLGGGAEGLLAEILKHPVDHVDYVEPDWKLIELIHPFLSDDDRAALNDPRLTVHHVDARHFIKQQMNRYDLVLARFPEPTSAQRARFYTTEFYRDLRRAMKTRAVLCTSATATPGGLTAVSAEYLASLRATIGEHFPEITIAWGNPAQVLAATNTGLTTTDPAELRRRYERRRVRSTFFDPDWFDGATDWLEPSKVQQRADELDDAPRVQISTDLHPIIYLQRLVLWERMTGGRTRTAGRRKSPVFERLRSLGWVELTVGLSLIGLITFLLGARRPRGALSRVSRISRSAVTFSIATTGFVTMALSMVWLFAFQNLYGFVYQRIGWIVALFMGGLVVGCGVMSLRWRQIVGGRAGSRPSSNVVEAYPRKRGHGTRQEQPATAGLSRQTAQWLWRWIVIVDGLMVLLAIAVPGILTNLSALQGTSMSFALVEICISALVAVTGLLGGAAFALAGGLRVESTGLVGEAAGSVVGADHAGACLGALISGVVLIPVFGTIATACVLAAVKLSSVALLVVGRRFSRAV